MDTFHGTTIIAVKKDGHTVVAGDGQVTLGSSVVKHKAKKVRRIYKDKIVVGFAGATADALTLSEKLEAKLEAFSGNLTRAAVELARDWRTDRMLRRLEAMMLAASSENIYLLSGTGDIIEPDGGVISIGSGSVAAQAAGEALFRHSDKSAKEIAMEAMDIAAGLCIYTNGHFTIEEL